MSSAIDIVGMWTSVAYRYILGDFFFFPFSFLLVVTDIFRAACFLGIMMVMILASLIVWSWTPNSSIFSPDGIPDNLEHPFYPVGEKHS